MKLENYCLTEFYDYFGLPSQQFGIDNEEESTELKKSSKHYSRFCKIWANLLAGRESEAAAALYAVIPSALAASSGATAQDLYINKQIARDVEDFISTWPYSNAPFSLNHIALDVRQKQLFQRVPIRGNSLDLGAGDGNASNFIFKPNKLSIGSDPLLSSTLTAKKHNRYDMQACLDMTNVPFRDESFDTIFMVHSIDHIKNRYDALSEAARLLRGGGMLALTDSTSHAKDLLPMARIWTAAGMPEQAAGAFDRLLDVGGERTEFFLADFYVKNLESLGFDDIKVEYFTSSQLTKKVYLHLELQFALGYFVDFIRSDADLRNFFFEQAKKIIVPLLSKDEELCREGKTMDMFVTARKRGRTNAEPDCLSSRYICPACGAPLSTVECVKCLREYPVIEGIPLLIPFYADAWVEIKKILVQRNR